MECDVLNDKINSGLIRKLSTDGFAVYSMLVAHRDDLNLTTISLPEISRLTGLSRTTIREKIKSLTNLDLAKIEKTTIGFQNTYEVSPDRLKELSFEEEIAKDFFIESVATLVKRTIARNNFGYNRNNTEYQQILGCTREEYADYLESQFIGGMSFMNRERWQIDHIISLGTARTIEEFLALFTNASCHGY